MLCSYIWEKIFSFFEMTRIFYFRNRQFGLLANSRQKKMMTRITWTYLSQSPPTSGRPSCPWLSTWCLWRPSSWWSQLKGLHLPNRGIHVRWQLRTASRPSRVGRWWGSEKAGLLTRLIGQYTESWGQSFVTFYAMLEDITRWSAVIHKWVSLSLFGIRLAKATDVLTKRISG